MMRRPFARDIGDDEIMIYYQDGGARLFTEWDAAREEMDRLGIRRIEVLVETSAREQLQRMEVK